MAGERDEHDERITDAIRHLAGDDRRLDPPPAELWGRIAGALDEGGPELPTHGSPPADLWDRIAGEVRELGGEPEALASPTAPSVLPAPVARRRPVLLIALAAAAALVIVAAGVLVLRRGDGTPSSELVASATLTGEGLDPGGPSTGTAELVQTDGSWTVDIGADDLPTAASGTYYEAWLLGDGPGQVQSLGALDGSGAFAVPAGLDLADFPLVDVSVEPIDGNPAHSAKSVLRGRLEPT